MIELLYIILLCSIFLILNSKPVTTYKWILIILIIALMSVYKMSNNQRKETFLETTIKTDDVENVLNIYEDPIDDLPSRAHLVFYTSCFSKKFIDNQFISNHLSKSKSILIDEQVRLHVPTDYIQTEGFFIKSKVWLPKPNVLLTSFDKFSLIFRVKFPFKRVNKNTTISLIKFGANNVCEGKADCPNISTKEVSHPLNSTHTGFFEILFEFEPNEVNLNPNIVVRIGSQEWKYIYDNKTDFDERVFMDEKPHIYSFIKDGENFKLYIDENLFIQTSSDNRIQISQNILYDDSSEIQLSSINNAVINYKNDDDNVKFVLSSIIVYKYIALDRSQISQINNYFKNIIDDLEPNKILLQNVISAQEQQNAIPTASQDACRYVDTTNMSELLKDRKCLNSIVAECDKDEHNLNICSLLNTSNINMLSPKNECDENSSSKSTSKLSHKAPIDSIQLKKRIDTNETSNTTSELKHLINTMMNENQTVNLDTINTMRDLNTISTNADSTNEDIYNTLNASRTATTTPVQIGNNEPNEIINIDKDEILEKNAYRHILNNHKMNHINDNKNNWSFMNLFT
jgi:hypothetical protein